MGKAIRYVEPAVLILGATFAVLSRLLYKSQYLLHWDSVQFALALDNLDILHHQPHPPGYIIYVWLAKLAHFVFADANTALIAVGILFTVAGLFVVYYFVKTISRSIVAAVIAVLIYLVNPLVWFQGIVAEVYIVEAVAALAVIWLIYRAWKFPTLTNMILAAVCLGLLGGIRQTTELVLLPLFIYILVLVRPVHRHWTYIGIAWVIANLLWFIPIIINTNGLVPYLQSLQRLTQSVIVASYLNRGVWGHIVHNAKLIIQAISITALPLLIVLYLAASPYLMRDTKSSFPIKWQPVWFWLLAILPILLLMIFGLMANPGYVLLPVLIIVLLAAIGVVRLAQYLSKFKPLYGNLFLIVAVILIVGSQIYTFYSVKIWELDYLSPSPETVHFHGIYMEEATDLIRSSNLESGAVLWIQSHEILLFNGLRHFQYYLPEVDVYRSIPEAFAKHPQQEWWHVQGPNLSRFESEAVIAPGIEKLFAITWPPDPQLDGSFQIPIRLSTGELITYYDLTAEGAKELLSRKYGFIFTEEL